MSIHKGSDLLAEKDLASAHHNNTGFSFEQAFLDHLQDLIPYVWMSKFTLVTALNISIAIVIKLE